MKKIILSVTITIIAIVTTTLIINKSATEEKGPLAAKSLADNSGQNPEKIKTPERSNRPTNKSPHAARDLTASEEIEEKIKASISSISDPGAISALLQNTLNKNSKNRGKSRELEIQSLIKKLDLNEEQTQALRDYMAEKDEALAELSSMDKLLSGKIDGENLIPLLKDDHFPNAMEPYLSDEQNEALAAHQKSRLDNKIDSSALNKLSEIQSAVNLSPEQREKVYEQLTEEATNELSNKSDAALIQDHIASSFGSLGGNARTRVFNANQGDAASQIDSKVEKMNPILDDVQLEQYRNHLEINSPKGIDLESLKQGL